MGNHNLCAGRRGSRLTCSSPMTTIVRATSPAALSGRSGSELAARDRRCARCLRGRGAPRRGRLRRCGLQHAGAPGRAGGLVAAHPGCPASRSCESVTEQSKIVIVDTGSYRRRRRSRRWSQSSPKRGRIRCDGCSSSCSSSTVTGRRSVASSGPRPCPDCGRSAGGRRRTVAGGRCGLRRSDARSATGRSRRGSSRRLSCSNCSGRTRASASQTFQEAPCSSTSQTRANRSK